MKLYSTRQVVFFSAVSAGTAIALALALWLAFGRGPEPSVQNPVNRPAGSTAARSGDISSAATRGGDAPAGGSRQRGSTAENSILQTNGPTLEGATPVQDQPGGYTPDEADNIRVYEARNEGVVNITTETVAYNWFLEPVPQSGGTGSGSIIDARGYVLTNNHVIQGASRVYVTLADGTRLDGQVAGVDAENDLAIVKFQPPPGRALVTIPLGSSSGLRVGQKVLAIGNPFALDRTLTTGIVSGLGRPLQTSNNLVIRDMIQTDASINPGNSGGPLLDSHGDMIGINTMIYSPSGGSIGIGFAVPVDTARRVVPDLIKYGVVKRGWIDIVPRQLFPPLVQYASLPVDEGVLVSQVVSGGNAVGAGIHGGDPNRAVRYGSTIIYLGGDIIVQINDTPVRSLANLYEALENTRPGDRATVVVMRGKQRKEFQLVLSDRPSQFQWK